VTIDVLPDDVLVDIFNFYVNINDPLWYTSGDTWHALVYVCRRWRYLVLASPRRLKLRLKYEGRGPMSEVLNTWPVMPVLLISRVEYLRSGFLHPESGERWDNVVAALESEHYHRICEIYISGIPGSRWERFAAAMQKPFPELTRIEVSVYCDVAPVLPDSFLGGSAPRLRTFSLEGIPFPSIPTLLLSANGLTTLTLWDIPDSGYFSSDAIATALTVMTTLESLRLQFRPPQSRPDPASRPLPPLTRFVLPALTKLTFKGVYEYLEDLLVRIDTPLLHYLYFVPFMDFDFDVQQLHRLIGHAEEHIGVFVFNHSIQLRPHQRQSWSKLRRLL